MDKYKNIKNRINVNIDMYISEAGDGKMNNLTLNYLQKAIQKVDGIF